MATANNEKGIIKVKALIDIINRKVRIHLELDMEYPYTFDIVQTIKEITADFSMPFGVDIKDVHLTSIQLLGWSDVK